MISSNKRIIAIEGLDCVGKTTYLSIFKKTIKTQVLKNPVFDALYDRRNVIFEHFPTDGSEARRIRKTETNVDEKALQKLMMEDLVQRIDKFCNQDKQDIMICDRFLFSNYLYSFDMTLSQFIIELSSIWGQYNLPLYDIFIKNHVSTIVVDIPEEERLKRLFLNYDREQRDSNETEEYQQALFDRYKKMIKEEFNSITKTFNLSFWIPPEYHQITSNGGSTYEHKK